MLAEVVVAHRDRAVVRAGDVFLKVDEDGDRLDRETAALAGIDRSAVPAPHVLWHRPGPPHLLALSAVVGSPLALLGSPSPHGSDAWVAAGAVARALHDLPPPAALRQPSRYRLDDVDDLVAWLHAQRVAPRALVEAQAEQARAACAAAGDGAPEVFVHGDLQAAHVFVRDGDGGGISGVIDWGDAGLGDPHHDLAVLTVGHDEHLEAVLAGYGDAAIDVGRIRGHWSWRRLGSVRWMLRHGLDASGDLAALRYGI